jgi:hypothetical protein
MGKKLPFAALGLTDPQLQLSLDAARPVPGVVVLADEATIIQSLQSCRQGVAAVLVSNTC